MIHSPEHRPIMKKTSSLKTQKGVGLIEVLVSVLIMVVLWNAGYIISSMHNIDPLLAEKAVGYLRALLWGAPGYLFFQVARNQCEGLAKTKPGMVMGFIGLLVNIPVNYIFIYGFI